MIVVVGEIVGVGMIAEAGRIVGAEMITCYLWVRVLKMISVLSYLNRVNPKQG